MKCANYRGFTVYCIKGSRWCAFKTEPRAVAYIAESRQAVIEMINEYYKRLR